MFLLILLSLLYVDTIQHREDIIIPILQVVFKGSRALIACTSEAIPKYYKDGKKVQDYFQIGNILIINNVNISDSGHYLCLGFLDNKSFQVSSELVVGGNVKVTVMFL